MVSAIVIDDEDDAREVFSEYLKIKGVEVVGTGKDGKDAIKLYRLHCPDVVLMDVLMPQYDGIYGLQQIKNEDKRAKIIMISASISSQIKCDLYDKGAFAVLDKPFDIDEILQVILLTQKTKSRFLRKEIHN